MLSRNWCYNYNFKYYVNFSARHPIQTLQPWLRQKDINHCSEHDVTLLQKSSMSNFRFIWFSNVIWDETPKFHVQYCSVWIVGVYSSVYGSLKSRHWWGLWSEHIPWIYPSLATKRHICSRALLLGSRIWKRSQTLISIFVWHGTVLLPLAPRTCQVLCAYRDTSRGPKLLGHCHSFWELFFIQEIKYFFTCIVISMDYIKILLARL